MSTAAAPLHEVSTLEKETMRKVFMRIIPFVIFAYFLCFIDRINISFAALTMSRDLALTSTMFGFGAGVFFIGYFIAEVPSNVLLERFGTRLWIARIMVTWGIISALMSMVTGEYSFYIMRFLLGVAEAGFFPGVVFYFTYWFPARYRAKVSSRFLMASPLSLMIGAPLSTWLLGFDGIAGFAGWQWLFILEGVPTMLFGVVTFFFLTNRPREAQWLNPEEREWLENTMEAERADVQKRRHFSLKDALLSPIVLVLGFVYFCTQMPGYGFQMWIPQVLQSFGGLTNIQIGFITSIPFLFALIGLGILGWSSDRTMERKWHFIAGTVLAGGGMIIGASLLDQPVMAVVCLTLCAAGLWGLMGVFWTIPPMFLTGVAAAGGIAFINSIGNLGGFFGPFVMGWLKDVTGSFSAGLICLGLVELTAGLVGYIIITNIQKRHRDGKD